MHAHTYAQLGTVVTPKAHNNAPPHRHRQTDRQTDIQTDRQIDK